MEGLIKRTYIAAAVVGLIAIATILTPRPTKIKGEDETWMGSVLPKQVGNYSYFVTDPAVEGDPTLCSYRTPKMVYDTLAPTVGIVARDYRSQEQNSSSVFDVQTIASRDRISFHDPRVCFTAQRYDIQDEQEVRIPTKTRGNVPVTLVSLLDPQGQQVVAAYCYKGENPVGFIGATTWFKLGMMWQQFLGHGNLNGVFYRFISLDSAGSLEDRRTKLIDFIGQYMDEAGKNSKGYF